MRITVRQENLHKALQDVRRVVPSKPQLPILQAVLLEAKDDSISISGTDLFTGIRTSLSGVVETPGQVAIPAQAFSESIATLSPGNLTISVENGVSTISGDGVLMKLQSFNGDEYPSFPEKSGTSIEVAEEDFKKIVEYVAFATAKEDSRPVLTAVLFKFGEQLEVVSTDGFRLAVLQLKHHSDEETTLLLPAKGLAEVSRLQAKQSGKSVTLTISTELKQVFCSFGEVEMVVRLMDGDFPPYQKIMPATFATETVIDTESFVQALKGAMVFAKDSSYISTFVFSGTDVVVKSVSPSLGQFETKVPLLKPIESSIEIAFNSHYLMEFVSALKPEKIWIGMNEPLQPAVFRPENMDMYTYVVMPFRVSQ